MEPAPVTIGVNCYREILGISKVRELLAIGPLAASAFSSSTEEASFKVPPCASAIHFAKGSCSLRPMEVRSSSSAAKEKQRSGYRERPMS